MSICAHAHVAQGDRTPGLSPASETKNLPVHMCKIRSKATGPGWGRGRAEVTGLRSRKVNGSVTVLRWLIRPSLQLSVFLARVCHMCGLWRGTNAEATAPDAGAAAAIGAGPGVEVPDAAVPFHPAPGAATARPRGSGEAGRGVRGREGAQGKRALRRTAGPHARPHRVCRSVGRRSPPGSYRLLSNDRGDMLTLQGSQGSALREATAQPSPQGDFRGPRPGPRPAPMEDPTATAQGPGPEAVREGTGCHPVTHDQTAAAPPGFTLGSRVQSTANASPVSI